ncbi:MAG: TIGR00701 family protein [Spirochaetaceae bacterium]|nr:TIGR00701 family protein [Spirochaetaceae bacterium]|tara:strand:- start:135208 stop:135630 length:423 start_codon:yes stop_codon:yes gene_type:complete
MYLWFKAIHLIFMVAWFAGMFYIWRLFVYHCETEHQEVRDQLAIMERKLYHIIMTPAMVITWVFGLAMVFMQWSAFAKAGWLHAKITLVLFLVFWHFLAGHYRKKLLAGNTYPSKKFRLMNEVPTLVLIAVVILAVIRPF